jgi:undecaprenyl-diphosphatase
MLPGWVQPIMELATLIGQPIVVLTVAIVMAATSLIRGTERTAIALGAGFAAFGINTLLKITFHRARPDTLYAHDMRIKSYSFPSGHAFGSIFFYGLLAYLAFNYLPQPWNVIVALALVFLIFLIGVSRVYLGAHFPSDVVAGWLFGFVCLVLVIKIVKP